MMHFLYLGAFVASVFFFNLWYMVLALLVSWVLAGLVISCIYHRQVSHNSWQYRNRLIEFIAYYLMILSGQGSPVAWAYIHRLHHRYTDTELDPQSPLIVGKMRTLFSRYKIEKFDPRLVKDLIRNKNIMFLHKHYNKLFLIHFIFWLLINPVIAFYLSGAIPIFCLLWVGVFNTIAHRKHLPAEKDQSIDMLHPVIFWGENNHRLHHSRPQQVCLGKYDTGFYLIQIFGKTQ